MVKNPPTMRETWVWSLDWEDPQEVGMATHSSNLAWRIPMDREAWWATVTGSQRAGHDWATKHSTAQNLLVENSQHTRHWVLTMNKSVGKTSQGSLTAGTYSLAEESWGKTNNKDTHKLEKAMTTHSSILAWRIPQIEDPGRAQSMGLQNSQIYLSD